MRKNTINYPYLNSLVRQTRITGDYDELWKYILPITKSQIANFQKENKRRKCVEFYKDLLQESYFVLRKVVANYDQTENKFNSYYRTSLTNKFIKVEKKILNKDSEITDDIGERGDGHQENLEHEQTKAEYHRLIMYALNPHILKVIDPNFQVKKLTGQVFTAIIYKCIFDTIPTRIIAKKYGIKVRTVKLFLLYALSILKQKIEITGTMNRRFVKLVTEHRTTLVLSVRKAIFDKSKEREIMLKDVCFAFFTNMGVPEKQIQEIMGKGNKKRLQKVYEFLYEKYEVERDEDGRRN